MKPIILIDARNTAYRAVFAARNKIMQGLHPFTVWMRFIHAWVEKFRPESIHVCWDCKTKAVWRREIYESYKDHREHIYNRYEDFNVLHHLNRLEDAARKILEHSNMRQYKLDAQEADDLIYAICKVITNQNIIIISSDKDLTQTMWKTQNVQVFDPIKSKFVDELQHNPVIEKALVGDKSDNIAGYRGIGPVKALKLMADKKLLREFLIKNGSEVLKRNLILIDMSKNPKLRDNIKYVQSIINKNINFDKNKVRKLVLKNKISGLMSEYHDLITPLKSLT